MKASAVVLATACLLGLSTASPIEDVVNNVVPNRNMPQTIEPYVDFGKSGFLYKKRQNDDNGPVPDRNMPKTIEYVDFGRSGFLKKRQNENNNGVPDRNMPKTIEYVDFGRSGFLKKRQNDDNYAVPDRNMPKTIEYVDFGRSGFLKKRRNNNAAPVPSPKIKRRSPATKTKKHKVTVVKKHLAKNGKKSRKTVQKGGERKLVTRGADNSNDNSGNGNYPNSGKGTFFSPTRGSCGWKNTNDDLVVAVNEGDMNNENSNCGRMVEIVNSSGDKVQAKVADTCPECGKGDLDLSPAAFIKLASFNQGIVKIKWKYLN